MKTSVLKAYNEYVVLANRYRHEKPIQLERSQVPNTSVSRVLQHQFLSKEANILLDRVKLAHYNFTEAIGGFVAGANHITVPATIRYGDLVLAPRYERELRDAIANGDEYVSVPVNDHIVVVNRGNEGTPLIYGYDETLFRDSMPYKVTKPIPQLI
jgi:hypothetical protein